ncbi:GYP5, partial [Symbiodinium sp. CCMP2456]
AAPPNDPAVASGEDPAADEPLPSAESEKVTAEHLPTEAESPEDRPLPADPLSRHEKQVADQIDSDLPRTFPNIQDVQAQRATIREVLLAFSKANPHVGYCQGMSFPAAVLCVHLPGSALEQFQACLENVRELWLPGFHLFETAKYAFDALLALQAPKLSRSFQSQGIIIDVFLLDAWLTLFARWLPFRLLPEVLEYIKCHGFAGILSLTVAVVDAHGASIGGVEPADALLELWKCLQWEDREPRLDALFQTAQGEATGALDASSERSREAGRRPMEGGRSWTELASAAHVEDGISNASPAKKNGRKCPTPMLMTDAIVVKSNAGSAPNAFPLSSSSEHLSMPRVQPNVVKDASLEYLQAQLSGNKTPLSLRNPRLDPRAREAPMQRHDGSTPRSTPRQGKEKEAASNDTHFVPLRQSLNSSESCKAVAVNHKPGSKVARKPSVDSSSDCSHKGSASVPSGRPSIVAGSPPLPTRIADPSWSPMPRPLLREVPGRPNFGYPTSVSPMRREGVSVSPFVRTPCQSPCRATVIQRPAPPSPRAIEKLLNVPIFLGLLELRLQKIFMEFHPSIVIPVLMARIEKLREVYGLVFECGGMSDHTYNLPCSAATDIWATVTNSREAVWNAVQQFEPAAHCLHHIVVHVIVIDKHHRDRGLLTRVFKFERSRQLLEHRPQQEACFIVLKVELHWGAEA